MYIGIDLGTSGVKLLIVNKNNSLYSESMAEVSLNMTVKRNIIDCDINLNEIRNNDVHLFLRKIL